MTIRLEPGTSDVITRMIFGVEEDWEPPDRDPAEPHQQPPQDRDWDLWLLEGGRGSGKTEACSRYFTKWMRANPGHRGRIIAPTYDDAVESCVKGPSGLEAIDREVKMVVRPGGTKVVWPNGSEALVLGTHSPRDVDRLRAGGNRHIDWWEEMAANPQLEDAWDQAAFGLRLGDWPHSIGSTTPRNTTPYRQIRNTLDVHSELKVRLTHATIFDNPHLNLSWREKMVKRYEGTRIGRQELYGELLEDIEGALWSRRMIEAGRIKEGQEPEFTVINVAIDPAATSSPEADDTGIVAAAWGVDGELYVLADRTCHLDPDGWGQRAVRTYKKLQADRIVGEINNGGEMVEHVIKTVSGGVRVPFRPVRASRGKQTRAQPVAALYGNPPKRAPKVHHIGVFPELEDQLCTWVPGEEDSPDRLDALVWAITDLALTPEKKVRRVEYYQPERIGADL